MEHARKHVPLGLQGCINSCCHDALRIITTHDARVTTRTNVKRAHPKDLTLRPFLLVRQATPFGCWINSQRLEPAVQRR